MLIDFLLFLRNHRVPVSTREFMDLLDAMKHRLVRYGINDFYFLSRLVLVKDEKLYDRFDLAFAEYFRGLELVDGIFAEESIDQLLRQMLLIGAHSNSHLLEDVEKLIAEYRERIQLLGTAKEKTPIITGEPGSQDDSGEPGEIGDSGDGGDSDESGDSGDGGEGGENGESGESGEEGQEGNEGDKGKGAHGKSGEGYSERGVEGVKTEQSLFANRRAAAIWEKRLFADYDEEVELGTRNLKIVLRRLRKFARTGAELELDLPSTISSTARNGGLLDIKMIPEKHNAIKVLLFFDVGGSMDDHIRLSEQLFSAARAEFKHLEYFYFHNFIYESVWTDNARRSEERVKTMDILNTYGRDYKVIFVGDAHMARHEIAERGGSVEHYNAEPGETWISRVLDRFRSVAWINPVVESKWQDSYTTVMTRRLVNDQMYPLSPAGLESAMRYLAR